MSGRTFDASDTADTEFVAVVNRELVARYFETADPVGSRVTMMDADDDGAIWYTIVGVVEDVPHLSLDVEPRPLLYTPFDQTFFGYFGDWGMNLVVRTEAEPLEYVDAIRREVAGLGADLPLFDVRTMQQRLDERLSGRRFILTLIGLFALVAIALAAVGVYGVTAYAAAQRTRETGLRLALGARPGEIRRLVLADGLLLATIGVAVGVGAALALSRLLESLVFGIAVRDLGTFLAVAVLVLTIAVVASAVPALRQSRVDPAIALRGD